MLARYGLAGYDGPVYVTHQHTADCHADGASACRLDDQGYLSAYPNVTVLHRHDAGCPAGCAMPETRYRIGAGTDADGDGGSKDADFAPSVYVNGMPGAAKDTGGSGDSGDGGASIAYHVHGDGCGEGCGLPVVLDGGTVSLADARVITCGKAEHAHGAGCRIAGARSVMALAAGSVARNETTGREYPSLSKAISEAKDGDTVVLLDNVTESVSITGSSAMALTIDLNGKNWTSTSGSTLSATRRNLNLTVRNGAMNAAAGRVVDVTQATVALTMEDITIEGYAGATDAVYFTGAGSFKRCVFKGNAVTGSSASILRSRASSYPLSITDCAFVGNTSGNSIIEITSSEFAMTSTDPDNPATKVQDNRGNHVVWCTSPAVTVSGLEASGNHCSNDGSMNSGGGGVMYIATSKNGSTVTLSDVKAHGNHADKGYGGAFVVYSNYSAVFNMDGCEISGNTAAKPGGGVYLYAKSSVDMTAVITDTGIHGNKSYGSLGNKGAVGGGLYVDSVNAASTVTLGAGTRVYANNLPAGGEALEQYSADIGLASASVDKNGISNYYRPKTLAEFDGKHAALAFGEGYVFEVTEGDCTYVMSGEPQASAKYPAQYGTNKTSPKYPWYWPIGYSCQAVKPVAIHLGGAHEGDDSVIVETNLADAVGAAIDNGQDVVYVCKDVALAQTDEQYLNASGMTFKRCAGYADGYLFTSNGNVTLDGAHIDGNNIESKTALLHVTGGTLTITGETVVENGWNDAQSYEASKGHGGGIRVDGGTLAMTGGTIRNCVSRYAGGGIYGANAIMYFDGGEVTGNKSGDGGGLYLFGSSSKSYFGARGGRTTFSKNAASAQGGGVALNGGSHEITRATFTGNSAQFNMYDGGGAIYINNGTTVRMRNVFVNGNTSQKGGAEGGAVTCCPTGNLIIYERDGLLAINNGNQPDIRVSPFNANPYGEVRDPVVYMSNAALGGDVAYTNARGTEADVAGFRYARVHDLALYANVPAGGTAIEDARALAEADGVVITGNRAYQMGAGIMSNGVLVIGTESKTIRVTKEWSDGNGNHADDRVLVCLTRDGEPVPVEDRADAAVVLDASNGWTYTWGGLDAGVDWGFTEAVVPGYAGELGEEAKSDEFAYLGAEEFYVRVLANTPDPGGDGKALVITKTAYGLAEGRKYGFNLELGNIGDGVFALRIGDDLYPIHDGKAAFQLEDGQSATVEGLPEGFTYEVTEEASPDYTTEQRLSKFGDQHGFREVLVDFINTATGSELPKTGGAGTGAYAISGMVLIAVAGMGVIWYAARKKK